MPCRRWLVPVALFIWLAQHTLSAAPDGDLGSLLRDAHRFAWLTNWGAAGPIYASAEPRRQPVCAIRPPSRRDAAPSARALSEELALQLAQPLIANDSRLRLGGLTVKGDIDLE